MKHVNCWLVSFLPFTHCRRPLISSLQICFSTNRYTTGFFLYADVELTAKMTLSRRMSDKTLLFTSSFPSVLTIENSCFLQSNHCHCSSFGLGAVSAFKTWARKEQHNLCLQWWNSSLPLKWANYLTSYRQWINDNRNAGSSLVLTLP